jgi:hypothetical protein
MPERLIGYTLKGGIMPDTQTAIIFPFPIRAVPARNSSIESDLAQLRRDQLACAIALRDCASALEVLVIALKRIIGDRPHG